MLFRSREIHLAVAGTALTADGGRAEGAVIVLDDVTPLIRAQRVAAWRDVARRLAHEIKNPLTPIQLSAERLAMKLESKLVDADRALLDKSVRTIVDQVDAMKRLVNEFRDYARLPQAELAPVDLNALVRDLLQLYLSEHQSAPVRVQLDEEAPLILGDAQQLRDRKSTRLNSSHSQQSRMPSSA